MMPNCSIEEANRSVAAAASSAQSDPTRPLFHFLPPAFWMNDPNGPIRHRGVYHLFYQHNPYGDDWGHMHWGHARSRDLVHWEHLPIALWPSLELGEEHVFSGCAGIDGRGGPLLLYTSVKSGAPDRRPPNEQWAAVPLDADWLVWQKHPANPILALKTHGGPPFAGDWRDPFLFTHAGRTFLILGGVTAETAGVALYEAADETLLRWRYCGLLYTQPRSAADFLECPNFVRVPSAHSEAQWMLITSPFALLRYVTGRFDAAALTFAPLQEGILDAGHGGVPNFYASNIVHDEEGRPLLLGWVRGFAPGRGWNGCLALPRRLSIGPDGHPRQEPIGELQRLRADAQTLPTFTLAEERCSWPNLSGTALELQVTLELGTAAAAGLRLCCSASGERAVEVRWDGAVLTVAGCEAALPVGRSSPLRLHLFLDRSVLELFAHDGRLAVTRVLAAPAEDQGVEFFAEGGQAHVAAADAWHLRSIW